MTATITETSTPRTLHVLGNTLVFHVVSSDTNGAWSLLEYTCQPHFRGPAPHTHATFTEAFYILGGHLEFQMEGERRVVRAGEALRVEPGVAHTFANPFDQPARFLTFMTPGGFEGYFSDLAGIVAASPSWPPQDLGVLADLTARYDLHPVP
ncbi:cupin domain-containing protein [Deinococcus apachensis]|uniref:cupin domain-containing protein n=1 Tax=Deinococcus apachensis TaxID=309886 RepID=UPI0003788B6F|nr:cupin domain-containing protein [Deinococcus apachensis]